MTQDYYERWSVKRMVQRFREKTTSEFFASEVYFLEKIIDNVSTVLDIGCASGKYIELLKQYKEKFQYTGIDVVDESIQSARLRYPGHKFICGNAIDIILEGKYDLINAIGVFQHEPNYMLLLRHMLIASQRYVLFDVKFANVQDHVKDINISYSGLHKKTYFILLNYPSFIEELSAMQNLGSIEIYGYCTELNTETIVPRSAKNIISATVLGCVGENHNGLSVVNNLSDEAKAALSI